MVTDDDVDETQTIHQTKDHASDRSYSLNKIDCKCDCSECCERSKDEKDVSLIKWILAKTSE